MRFLVDARHPLFDTLLLDAGAAWATGDYRKAILFSALAMEGAAKEALGEAYARALATRPPGLHVIDVPTKSGTTRKDPVYEALCEGTKFDRLTHERPLYLLGRSMQLEDADLYRLSKRLYETRNKLAHGVEPGEEQTNALPLLIAAPMVPTFVGIGDHGSGWIPRRRWRDSAPPATERAAPTCESGASLLSRVVLQPLA